MSLPIPTLLLAPGRSRDRNGPVSPTLTGAVRVVEGQHGPAWFVEEGTTNYVLNPRWNGGGGWSQGSVNGNPGYLVEQDTTVTVDGVPSLHIERVENTWGIFRATVPTVGVDYTVSVLIYGGSGNEYPNVNAWNPSNQVVTYASSNTTHDLGNGWRKLVAHINPGTDATEVRCEIRNFIVGQEIWLCQPQVEQKPYATSYCDGSLGTGYTWAGTAHNSASTRDNSIVEIPNMSFPREAGTIAVRFRAEPRGQSTRYLTVLGRYSVANQPSLRMRYRSEISTGLPTSYRSDIRSAARTSSGAVNIRSEAGLPAMESWHTEIVDWSMTELGSRMDGGVRMVDAVDTPPVADFYGIFVGRRYGDPRFGFNGQVESVLVLPERITQAQGDELFAMDTWEWDRFGGRTLAFAAVGT